MMVRYYIYADGRGVYDFDEHSWDKDRPPLADSYWIVPGTHEYDETRLHAFSLGVE